MRIGESLGRLGRFHGLGRSGLAAAGAAFAAGAAVAALVAWLLWPSQPHAQPSPQPTLRLGEIAVHASPARTGKLTIQPVAMKCGMIGVIGTHAELPARGQFCRIRVAITNPDPTFHSLSTLDQRLRTTDGRLTATRREAILVTRQAETLTVGRQMRVELDLYFDIPAKATADALVARDSEGSAPATIPLPAHRWPSY